MEARPLPRRYRNFDVMLDRGTRARFDRGELIDCGEVGRPPEYMTADDEIAWVDLVNAAPAGMLERHHCFWLEVSARVLAQARRGRKGRTADRLLRSCLRDLNLRPGPEPTPAEILDAFKPKGQRVN